ncbi:cysteine--tRNA ligase [Facklamia miroungae]|uniref:Cysteine--tRNA ligase n=1 Tax=Facklamia miroungae TaxID=120956 RepID=A0A1G7SVS0_9LACT|nr:cysteine--tRNA ligase [Facklamia miroungae]NKZ29518.1 cysteine--tRNA ligase [Facklamia miroungae]SDG27071.1 cysteinyl-tRNA synthetase [Facklamia miroungae]
MAIQLFNTLSRQKELFHPNEEGKVSFYLCGPTVYNYIHIGNARSAVAFDTIRRYLEYRGYEVNFVSNFTDVDDKIIKASENEGITAKELSDKYIAAYKEDMRAINVKPATYNPRVMENIPEIIQFIQVLIDKGYAYESQGDVYYRTGKFEKYGQLSDQSISDLREGASQRITDDEREKKENAIDFALWKADEKSAVSWDSPWSKGRPGWHIECSVMATKYLGESIDIHGGGQDLQFPHHENEIAQSEAHSNHDHPFAKYWLHNGFVTVGSNGEKMSKSLGNFVLLRDILKECDPMVIRYLLASVQYRRPIRYDHNAINTASREVERLRELVSRLTYRMENPGSGEISLDIEQEVRHALEVGLQSFNEAMEDDFNTANALSAVFEMAKQIHRYLDQEKVELEFLQETENQIKQILAIFGLDLGTKEVLDSQVENLIEERNQARAEKNFHRADEIRDWLKEQNILLDDTPQGTRWKRG